MQRTPCKTAAATATAHAPNVMYASERTTLGTSIESDRKNTKKRQKQHAYCVGVSACVNTRKTERGRLRLRVRIESRIHA